MVTWEIDIYNVDVSSSRADIQAVRIDDQIPSGNRTYSFTSVPLATAQQRINILNTIKSKVEEDELIESGISQFVGTLESDAKANLETWEGTR